MEKAIPKDRLFSLKNNQEPRPAPTSGTVYDTRFDECDLSIGTPITAVKHSWAWWDQWQSRVAAGVRAGRKFGKV